MTAMSYRELRNFKEIMCTLGYPRLISIENFRALATSLQDASPTSALCAGSGATPEYESWSAHLTVAARMWWLADAKKAPVHAPP